MPYVVIEDFKGGLDKRRMQVTTPLGSLIVAKNVHVTRGGEIESALVFSEIHTNLQNTYGVASINDDLYVFGSVATPATLPVGLNYQRLQNPDSSAMTGVVSVKLNAGKFYVVADFADGTRHHFYDGVIISDWYEGLVRTSMTNNSGIATHLKELLDASASFTATVSGAEITLTEVATEGFTVDTVAENGTDNTENDQTLDVIITTQAVEGQLEVLATGSFRVTGGTNSAGVNTVASVKANGVEILSVAVDWATSNSATATAVAAQINSYSSTPEYSATASGDMVTISAAVGTGDGPNGYELTVTIAGNVTVADVTDFAGGVDAVTTNFTTGTFSLTPATAHPIVTPYIHFGFAFKPTKTGTLVSCKINVASYTSAGVYEARLYTNNAGNPGTQIGVSSGTVTINSTGDKTFTFATPPSITSGVWHWIAFNNNSGTPNFTVSTAANDANYQSGQSPTVLALFNNLPAQKDFRVEVIQNATVGTAQVSKLTVDGTFEPGDLFSVTLNADTLDEEFFGAGRVTGMQVTRALEVHKDKVYTAEDNTLLFSGVAAPTGWRESDTGSGFIDMSTQASGFQTVTALGAYQNRLAVFSRRSIQIWAMDPDPDLNEQLQVLNNVGTRSPGSVVGFGDNDLFFLADNGVRSLQARDSSNAAAVTDVGTPIDTLIVADMKELTDAEIEEAQAVMEPTDGRYILSVGEKMYVFSYFPSSKVSSWSTYEQEIRASHFTVAGNEVYARVGTSIYLLGGENGDEYSPSGEAVFELPFVSANRIATWKQWTGIDVACEGVWDVYLCTDANQPDEYVKVAGIRKHSYNEMKNALIANAPMIKLKFVKTSVGYGRIGAVVLHFRGTKDA